MFQRNFTVAHLVAADSGLISCKKPIAHVIAVPSDARQRPSVIVTEDGKVWMWGGEYRHFPNTCFYLEVQPAFFSKRQMAILSKAVPTLERQGVL